METTMRAVDREAAARFLAAAFAKKAYDSTPH
jgi:hypothetical protein